MYCLRVVYEVAQRAQAFDTEIGTRTGTGTGVMAAQIPAATPYRSWLPQRMHGATRASVREFVALARHGSIRSIQP